MREQEITAVSEALKEVVARGALRRLGEESGFIIRERTITADRFVPSILKSFASREVESIADLQRDFNFDHGLAVHYKPYYDKLKLPGFPRMMMGLFESMLTTLSLEAIAPLRDGPFARFTDILIHDGSSFAVNDALAGVFAGRFVTVSPAAVELHCTMSLFSDNLEAVTLTGDAECERHYLPDPRELKGKLLMGDRGYDSTKYMQAVDEQGGCFLIRIRKSLNPRVIQIHHRRGERYRKLEGRPLRSVLRQLPKGETYDMDICWDDGDESRCYFRLAVRWNPAKKEWVRLLTNLDRESFSVDDILQSYRLRWQIELLFKELKSYANLHGFSTTKETIAEGMIWTALAAAFLKRYLAHACQRACGRPISTRRVAMCGQVIGSICDSVKRGLRDLRDRLREAFNYLRHNAQRSNLSRERRRGRLAIGLELVGAADASS